MSKIQQTVTNLDDLTLINLESISPVKDIDTMDEKDIDTLRQNCVDLFLPIQSRINFLVKFYNYCITDINYGFGEIISRITGMYLFSKTKNLEDYINHICQARDIGLSYRIESAKCIEDGYHHINSMFDSEKDAIKTLSTPIRIDTVLFLMKSEKFKEQAREYFCEIINDPSIEEIYRYRTIQKLESTFEASKTSVPLRVQRKKNIEISDKNIQKFIYYAREACIRFVKNTRNTFTYRILACQYLLEKCNIDIDQEITIFLEGFLISVANDHTLVDDVRADACDVILQYGSTTSRDMARTIIIVLGGEDRGNIFDNKQNVHNRHIEKSIQEIVDKLVAYHPKDKKTYIFKDTKDTILKSIKDEGKEEKELKEKVEGSLIRITLDRAVYGNSNVTLMTILLKVWTYIQDSPFKEDLEKRLVEELSESNSKCSSGFAGRLVNTLSGYDESMSISIGFSDQIISNLSGRLTSKIKDIKDEEYMDKVLSEMTIPNIHYNLRGNFLKFFRENISHIRQEMYQEFCTYMEDIDYDLFFKKAVMSYEGYN
jgi:hypothetical protein